MVRVGVRGRDRVRDGVGVRVGVRGRVGVGVGVRVGVAESRGPLPKAKGLCQRQRAFAEGLVTDHQGRIVLGSNKFLILSKRLVRGKVRDKVWGHIWSN